MKDDSPYESPTPMAQDSESKELSLTLSEFKAADYVHLGLRFMGIFLLANGFAGIVGSLTYARYDAFLVREQGYEPIYDPYAVSWFVSSFALFLIGFFFVVGRRFIFGIFFFDVMKVKRDG